MNSKLKYDEYECVHCSKIIKITSKWVHLKICNKNPAAHSDQSSIDFKKNRNEKNKETADKYREMGICLSCYKNEAVQKNGKKQCLCKDCNTRTKILRATRK